jgi:hypothetical protein
MTLTPWSGLVVLMAAAVANAQESPPARPDLEVVLIVDGGMTPEMHYWLLRVGFEGEIEGGGDLNPGLPAPPKKLTPAAHARLEKLIDKERFFDRPYRGIGCAPDLGGRVIKAWRGRRQRSVSFCVERPDVAVADAQSVLRVWYGVLSVVAGGKRVPVADIDKRLLAKQR